MTIRRTSVILPCRRLDEFPTHLTGPAAAELLAAWTTLWHPALIHAIGRLPGWHPADEPPDPSALDGELVIVPSVSRSRMPGDWLDQLRNTAPKNPPPVEAFVSRDATVSAALTAAAIESPSDSDGVTRDFLALGYAHLQVELLTRAMQYATVLDDQQFTEAVVEAAAAATGGDAQKAKDELDRAFDLLMDARNHIYSVDFYLVDVTLLASSTMGEPLRKKLADGLPTSLLATGELIERMAAEHPKTLGELRRAIDAGTASVFGGSQNGGPMTGRPPEAILADLLTGRDAIRRRLGCDVAIFGQFDAGFSPLLPEILSSSGFHAALHAAFDGGRFPRAEQRKTRWGPRDGPQIDALSATPLDVARPATWLKLAERIADSIAHDHVATVLLAGWPGHASEYFEDVRRAARYGTVIGKLVTLEEYFLVTREAEEWSEFNPSEYPAARVFGTGENELSHSVEQYRRDVADNFSRLADGITAIVQPVELHGATPHTGKLVTINPWNFSCDKFVGFDPLGNWEDRGGDSAWLPDVPGCGYAMLNGKPVAPTPVPIADGRTLHNEWLEVVVSATTGGIQSCKTHRDRSTRVSQRLIVHDDHTSRPYSDSNHDAAAPPQLETLMIADRIEITRNDAIAGEITARGRLVDAAGEVLARFTQATRLARGLPAVIVGVELDIERPLDGDAWDSYLASRLAWAGEAVAIRRGVEWIGRATTRSHIESAEWVEISDGVGTVTCFGCGLPLHRLAGPSWLDTLLIVAGEKQRRFQLAIGLDGKYPTQSSLALMTSGDSPAERCATRSPAASGWFLHSSAKNAIVTHIEPLSGKQSGVRLRLLETEGREAHTKLSAFRPFRAARRTDFLRQSTGLLSVVDGQVRMEIGPHRWVQVEAEW